MSDITGISFEVQWIVYHHIIAVNMLSTSMILQCYKLSVRPCALLIHLMLHCGTCLCVGYRLFVSLSFIFCLHFF